MAGGWDGAGAGEATGEMVTPGVGCELSGCPLAPGRMRTLHLAGAPCKRTCSGDRHSWTVDLLAPSGRGGDPPTLSPTHLGEQFSDQLPPSLLGPPSWASHLPWVPAGSPGRRTFQKLFLPLPPHLCLPLPQVIPTALLGTPTRRLWPPDSGTRVSLGSCWFLLGARAAQLCPENHCLCPRAPAFPE